MFSPIPKLLKIPDPDPGSPIPITRLIDRVIGLDRADRAIPINDRGRSGRGRFSKDGSSIVARDELSIDIQYWRTLLKARLNFLVRFTETTK